MKKSKDGVRDLDDYMPISLLNPKSLSLVDLKPGFRDRRWGIHGTEGDWTVRKGHGFQD